MADEMTKEMGTKTPSNEQKIGNLSGGNQQKALLGKWMFTEPDILILDEPTRGIDVGAKNGRRRKISYHDFFRNAGTSRYV